ncbi:hypothetical protein GCM10009085_19150 [Pseudomonas avellanae]|nr:hypothetical protein GCM10009085_19150 [Pseudomonas avellanae]
MGSGSQDVTSGAFVRVQESLDLEGVFSELLGHPDEAHQCAEILAGCGWQRSAPWITGLVTLAKEVITDTLAIEPTVSGFTCRRDDAGSANRYNINPFHFIGQGHRPRQADDLTAIVFEYC